MADYGSKKPKLKKRKKAEGKEHEKRTTKKEYTSKKRGGQKSRRGRSGPNINHLVAKAWGKQAPSVDSGARQQAPAVSVKAPSKSKPAPKPSKLMSYEQWMVGNKKNYKNERDAQAGYKKYSSESQKTPQKSPAPQQGIEKLKP